MKRLFVFLCLACLATACGEEKEVVFYSVTYPVTKIDAIVSIAAADPGTEEAPEDPDVAEAALAAEVVAQAPVQAGGSYRLDYSRYNGGMLTVVPAPAASAVTGEFVKEPGTTQLQLAFSGTTYSCEIGSYTTEEGRRCVLLTVDLTEACQERDPDARIQQVLRLEYTSTPVNQ